MFPFKEEKDCEFFKRMRVGRCVRKIQIGFYKRRYSFCAGSIILGALLFRALLIAHNWPATDSEEGTLGLEAMHIAFRGSLPIYYYGQNYMGVGEAYLGALLFRFFGMSLFSLRAGLLFLFALFLVLIYLLGSLLYGKKVACISLLLMMVGAKNVLIPEMKVVGGAVETLVCGTTVMLLALWLALNSGREEREVLWKRRFAYSGWGIAAGLGLWSHALVVPFVICSALLLFMFCREDLRAKNLHFILLSFIIGALPLIIYNLTAPVGSNSLAILIALHNKGYAGEPVGMVLWLKQFSGTFLYTLPIATGLPQIISSNVLPFYGPLRGQFLLPVLLYGLWSLGYIFLLVYSTKNSLKPLYIFKKRNAVFWELEEHERQMLILHSARLLLLLCAWLTILSYVSSATAAHLPWSYRYLIGLMIIIPAIIAPFLNNEGWSRGFALGRGGTLRAPGGPMNSLDQPPGRTQGAAPTQIGSDLASTNITRGMPLLQRLCILLLLLVPLVGTIQDLSTLSEGNRVVQQQGQLIDMLVHRGVSTIYSGYWVCDRVIFQSQEKVICAAIENDMKMGLTRYAHYKNIVKNGKIVAYVFTEDSTFHPQNLIDKFVHDRRYEQVRINNYIVFIPI